MDMKNVSDTAKWVAEYRAMETDRPDAIFRDPFARRLAGPDGAKIVVAMPKGKRFAWPMIVRTAVTDEIMRLSSSRPRMTRASSSPSDGAKSSTAAPETKPGG